MISLVTNECNMEMMSRYPDKFFELAIVDPPYGIGRAGQNESFTKNRKHKRKKHEDKKWDFVTPNKEYFKELQRVSVNQIIWGANYFTKHIEGSMGWIFWDKGQDLSMSDGELAYTSFQKALRRIVINRGQLVLEGGTTHPTQKPIKLYTWLLQNYAKQGDKILDTHLGSGSSRIASYELGFDFYACELDKDYFDGQEKRFQNHIKQQKLFAPQQIQTAEQQQLF